MALTDHQKHNARYHGGKDLANRKKSLAQASTVVDNLRQDCAGRDSTLAGRLSTAEQEILSKASAIVARLSIELARDAKEADQIKKDFDGRRAAAKRALYAAYPATPQNLIGLASLTYSFVLRDLMEAIRLGKKIDQAYELSSVFDSLAHDYAKSFDDIQPWMVDLAARHAAAVEQHADDIAKLNAALVAARLERAAA